MAQSRPGAVIVAFGMAILGVALVAADPAAASNVVVGLSEERADADVPTWLFLATGGGVIAASALLSMLVTDRITIEAYRNRAWSGATPRAWRVGRLALQAIGLAALGFVVVVGLFGPQIGSLSAAVLVTFVGLRAGLPMVAYLIGNPWPALNPWRTIATLAPNGFREYPSRLASWPAVAAVLALVWLEVVTPLAASPRTLALAVIGYSVLTVAGAVVFGPDPWFRHADPISVLFRLYGAVAPFGRSADGWALRAPGARLSDGRTIPDLSLVAFGIALVYELTYSGFIVTPPGAETVEALVSLGLPPSLTYLVLLVVGFGVFVGVYWLAAGRSRRRAETYLARRYLAIRFAPPLLAIAAGYHLAHYLGFVLSLWPSVVQTAREPLSPPPNPTVYAPPEWFGYVEIATVILGHLVAIWVAHVVAMELFPGKLQAIRSQWPFVAVMILFTVLSLWLVTLPTVEAPYVSG